MQSQPTSSCPRSRSFQLRPHLPTASCGTVPFLTTPAPKSPGRQPAPSNALLTFRHLIPPTLQVQEHIASVLEPIAYECSRLFAGLEAKGAMAEPASHSQVQNLTERFQASRADIPRPEARAPRTPAGRAASGHPGGHRTGRVTHLQQIVPTGS